MLDVVLDGCSIYKTIVRTYKNLEEEKKLHSKAKPNLLSHSPLHTKVI